MTVTITTLADSERNYVVNLSEETGITELTHILDISDVSGSSKYGKLKRLRLDKVQFNVNTDMFMYWHNGSGSSQLFQYLRQGSDVFDYTKAGGLNNNLPNSNGSVLFLKGNNSAEYSVTMWFTKKYS